MSTIAATPPYEHTVLLGHELFAEQGKDGIDEEECGSVLVPCVCDLSKFTRFVMFAQRLIHLLSSRILLDTPFGIKT